LIPTKPDYLSTLGIYQLRTHVKELVDIYNKYARNAGDDQWQAISPEIMGVIFTMVTFRNGSPISAQQQYIEEIIQRGIPVWST
jgi:chromosome partitioning protein